MGAGRRKTDIAGRKRRSGRSLSASEETEGVARRICEDPPTAGVDVQQRGAEAEELFLSLVKVRDIEVQMKLLRVRAVRPPRRPVTLHALERQDQARARVKGRKVVTDRPPGIGLVDRAAEERLVEPGEFKDIRTVQYHALQLADHRCSSNIPGPWLR
ncbi:hypothetical protein Srufu_066080 [Streptomyces libani subsp. rufus]|nr:hypothetical protein Srufu_066080 [Streptomyces libani subsp. rufus]